MPSAGQRKTHTAFEKLFLKNRHSLREMDSKREIRHDFVCVYNYPVILALQW